MEKGKSGKNIKVRKIQINCVKTQVNQVNNSLSETCEGVICEVLFFFSNLVFFFATICQITTHLKV